MGRDWDTPIELPPVFGEIDTDCHDPVERGPRRTRTTSPPPTPRTPPVLARGSQPPPMGRPLDEVTMSSVIDPRAFEDAETNAHWATALPRAAGQIADDLGAPLLDPPTHDTTGDDDLLEFTDCDDDGHASTLDLAALTVGGRGLPPVPRPVEAAPLPLPPRPIHVPARIPPVPARAVSRPAAVPPPLPLPRPRPPVARAARASLWEELDALECDADPHARGGDTDQIAS